MQKGISGMTSVTFRKKTVEQIIAIAVKANLKGIEWGSDVHVPVGNIDRARQVGEMTRAAGLSVFSYGAYLNVGESGFEEIAQTALALGCKTIRIWPPKPSTAKATNADFDKAINALKEISKTAAEYGVTVCMEWHNGRLNDCAESSLRMLKGVGENNIRTYWQPINTYPDNIRNIHAMTGYIENVHVYNWIYGSPTIRLPLAANREDWEKYIDALGYRNYILEFTAGDDDNNFLADVRTLKELLCEDVE